MTIDAHTRLWPDDRPWPLRRPPAHRWSRFSQAMHCIDRALVLGVRSERLNIAIPTAQVADFCDEMPEARIPFAAIDPLADSLADDLAEAADRNIAGITVAPADTGTRPTHDRFAQVLDWCARNNRPIHISNPFLEHPRSIMDFARHALLDEPLADFPNLRIVISDLGLVPIEETLLLLTKHDHIYAECSRIATRPWLLRHTLACAFEREVTSRLLIGSGFPFATPEQVITAAYSVNSPGSTTGGAPIPREIIRAIVDRDLIRLLDIEAPPLPAPTSATPSLTPRITEPAA